MSLYLASDSHLVHYKLFESAIIKIINGTEAHLTASERDAFKSIRNSESHGQVQSNSVQSVMSYFERIEAKRRRISVGSQFINCKFIPATSISVGEPLVRVDGY